MIELLVVMSILSILAIITLPNLVEQRGKGYDAEAKAHGRDAVTLIEACFTDSQDFRQCTGGTALGSDHGLRLGTGPGEVQIAAFTDTTYRVTARSVSGNTFVLERASDSGAVTRSCTVASGRPAGGCRGGVW